MTPEPREQRLELRHLQSYWFHFNMSLPGGRGRSEKRKRGVGSWQEIAAAEGWDVRTETGCAHEESRPSGEEMPELTSS